MFATETKNELLVKKIDFEDVQQRALFLTWTLHGICNYRCSYCPPGCHSGVPRPYGAGEVIEFCLATIARAKAAGFGNQTIAFSGGEPTLFPDFLRILRELTAAGADVTFTSNGSRRAEWWQEAIAHFNHCVFSFHPEMVDQENFFRNAELITQTAWLNVDMMMTPQHFDSNLEFAKRLQELPNIRVDFLPIQKEFGGESAGLIDYSPAQLHFLQNRSVPFKPMTGMVKEKIERLKFFGRGKKLVTLASGAQHEVRTLDYKDLIANDQNRFSGWDCWAGTESLIVDMHGKVYRAYCYEGGEIGTIWNSHALPKGPVRCGQKRCKCSVDIEVTKQDPLWREPKSEAREVALHAL